MRLTSYPQKRHRLEPADRQPAVPVAQRYVRLAQTRRTARTWQLNTGAAAMRTRYGAGVNIPTDNGAEIEALAGSNPSFAAWEQNGPYTIALLIKGRSGGASTKHLYRSGSSSTGNHILFLTSGTTPNLRHEASGGGTVTITSSVAIVNGYHLVDDRRDLATGTPRAVRGRLLACLQHSGGDGHQRPVRHLPLELGLLDLAGLQRRHRPDRVLGPPPWRAAGTPIRSASCAHGRGACAPWECSGPQS